MKLFRVIPALIVALLLCNQLKAKELSPLDSGKIKEQFNFVIQKSQKYNDYRVIKSTRLFSLKKHVFDTLDGLKADLFASNLQISSQAQQLDSLNAALANTQTELIQAIKARDSISFIGISIHKEAYNGIMWTLTGGLLALLTIFFILFKRSNSITSKSKKDIEELKEELHVNRKKAREREEKVVRRLHDEINRYKKRVYQLEKSSQASE